MRPVIWPDGKATPVAPGSDEQIVGTVTTGVVRPNPVGDFYFDLPAWCVNLKALVQAKPEDISFSYRLIELLGPLEDTTTKSSPPLQIKVLEAGNDDDFIDEIFCNHYVQSPFIQESLAKFTARLAYQARCQRDGQGNGLFPVHANTSFQAVIKDPQLGKCLVIVHRALTEWCIDATPYSERATLDYCDRIGVPA